MSNCKTNPSGLQFFSIVTGEPGSSTETCEQSGTERSDLSGAKAAAGAGEGVSGASSFPCLYKTNSTESDKDEEEISSQSRAYYRKAAYALSLNAEALVCSVGVDNIGFLTLTFPDNVEDHKEAYNRFRSLNSHYLKPHPHFGDWICVKERQKRGAWHYHLLIDCGSDIRTGIVWEEVEKGNYRSVPSALRALWAELREVLPRYNFGRSELLPVKSNAQGVARYLAKYLSKHLTHRRAEDKRVRLVTYSRNWLRSGTNFQWNNDNARKWRQGLAAFSGCFGFSSFEDIREALGDSWMFTYSDLIFFFADSSGFYHLRDDGSYFLDPAVDELYLKARKAAASGRWEPVVDGVDLCSSVRHWAEKNLNSPCPF